jgi:DNA repair ATPase RecN
MEEKLDLILSKLTSIETRLEKVEEEQKRHGDYIHQLIQTVASTNQKVNVLEEKVGNLEENVNFIKTNMISKIDLHYYDQKISEHDREIYKIKNR